MADFVHCTGALHLHNRDNRTMSPGRECGLARDGLRRRVLCLKCKGGPSPRQLLINGIFCCFRCHAVRSATP